MARYKPVERGGMFIPVMLSEQIQPGTFEFALDHLVDHELDLTRLDARSKERSGTHAELAHRADRLDPDSAKMATSKGVIQGYAAQAAVDSKHQIIVAVEVTGSGSEQAILLPMIDKAAPVIEPHTLITADTGRRRVRPARRSPATATSMVSATIGSSATRPRRRTAPAANIEKLAHRT